MATLADKPDRKRGRDPPVEPDRLRNRIGGQSRDELGRFHATDLRQAAPSDFSARWSATLTATSDIERRAAVAAIDWPSREIEVTMSRWRGASVSRSLRASLSACGSSASGRGQELLEILERLDPPPAAPAQGVHDLVPGYGVDPGRKRLPGVPGVPLEVDRQQGLLHCILDIRVSHSGARERPARHRPDRATDVLQEPPVSALIARDRGLHRLRPRIGRGTLAGWGFHTGFVSSRLPLQVRENISARSANDMGPPM